MFSILIKRIFCILILISCTKATATNDDFKDDSLDRGAHSDRQGLWFGPRLGKRSLQLTPDDSRQTLVRLLEAADLLKYYYDQLPYELQEEEPQEVIKKIIFTPKLGRATDSAPNKRYDNVEFTPRLGRRRTADVMPATTAEDESYRADPVMVNPMRNLFSPRLGRNLHFSPRLGRELNYDYADKIRVVRSANITKPN